MAMGKMWVATLVAMGCAGSAHAQAPGDGFTGWEKKVTSVTGQGEPEISIGPHGRPLVIAMSGCGAAVSRDRGRTFEVLPKHPADPGSTPGGQRRFSRTQLDAFVHSLSGEPCGRSASA